MRVQNAATGKQTLMRAAAVPHSSAQGINNSYNSNNPRVQSQSRSQSQARSQSDSRQSREQADHDEIVQLLSGNSPLNHDVMIVMPSLLERNAQYDDEETRVYAQQQQRQQQQQQQHQKVDQRGDSNSPATLASHGSESKRDRALPCSGNGMSAAACPVCSDTATAKVVPETNRLVSNPCHIEAQVRGSCRTEGVG